MIDHMDLLLAQGAFNEDIAREAAESDARVAAIAYEEQMEAEEVAHAS